MDKKIKAFNTALDSLLTASAALDAAGLSKGSALSLKIASSVVQAKGEFRKIASFDDDDDYYTDEQMEEIRREPGLLGPLESFEPFKPLNYDFKVEEDADVEELRKMFVYLSEIIPSHLNEEKKEARKIGGELSFAVIESDNLYLDSYKTRFEVIIYKLKSECKTKPSRSCDAALEYAEDLYKYLDEYITSKRNPLDYEIGMGMGAHQEDEADKILEKIDKERTYAKYSK